MSYTMRNLPELVDAGFSGLWIETHESEEALRELWRLAHDREWRMMSWDVGQGLQQQPGQGNGDDSPINPLKALEAAGGTNKSTAVLVLPNYHRFVGNTMVMQTLANALVAGKQLGTFVVVLAPTAQIPIELEKLFVVVEHELPDAAALMEIASGVGQEGELPESPADWDRLTNASAGLTRSEAEGAYSLSIIRHKRMDAETVWELKTAALQKSGLLTLHRGTEDFSQLCCLDRLKDFTLRSLVNHPAGVNPRGVLLVSPPGCGKAQLTQYPCRCGSL